MTHIRVAHSAEIPELNRLIEESARGLSVGYYTNDQTESAIRHVFGVDTQLLADETYYVIERDGERVACGGWSRRATLYGGDQHKHATADRLLDPATEAARIRAFFVHPSAARQGFGAQLLEHCLAAARTAGFRVIELGSTLPGVPFYRAYGFEEVEPIEVSLADGVRLPVIRMRRVLDADS